MSSRFFIDRPIFAGVLSIVITIAGGVALFTLPISQYPEITPPTIQISAVYPGASAQVVADTVGAPIEQQINGVERMLYMSSQSSNDGSYTLNVTFELGMDLNMAQVLVQNRASLALPVLPDIVRTSGVNVKKRSPDILLVVNMYSEDRSRDQLYLSNFATLQIRDELARLEGVGDVIIFGQREYSMRIWLDPNKLAARGLTTLDMVNSLREQNVQVAAGQIGQAPVPPGQEFEYTLTTLGRLSEPEQFANIILKVGPAGELIRVSDVARVELGARTQSQSSIMDGKPSSGIAVFQMPGSNALATADLVKTKMVELEKRFPSGVNYAIVYDTTPFVHESIVDVVKTLRDAFILVAIVVLVFLQSWRTTLIPLIAVPVSLIGTFAIMSVLGFSLNNLTLFGLVLAIGIVVDDAIVVVENVERWIERGLSPREASYKTMDEVTIAVIAIAFGLSAVFIPTAFIPGITGRFYRQFALTIATATLISAFNSLTLSPALAALLLQPHGARTDWLSRLLNFLFGWFFRGFNRVFNWSNHVYSRLVRMCVRGAAIALLVYFGLLGLTYYGLVKTPLGFIPNQDKGYLVASIQLPDAASLERTQDVVDRIGKIALATPGVKHFVGLAGTSFVLGTAASNLGSMFVILDEFKNRQPPELYSEAIAAKLRAEFFREIPEASIGVFGPTPVSGIGTAGGFKIMIEDRGSNGLDALQAQTENLVDQARQQPALTALFGSFRSNTPQLYIDIDRTEAKSKGVALTDIFNTLQVAYGGFYVNDFNRFGRTWQVNVEADAPYRVSADSIRQLKVRNAQGGMVPLGTLAKVEEISGPLSITRYNMYPAAPIFGAAAPGYSSGQALQVMQQLSNRELAPSMSSEWTELTLIQILAGNTALFIFPLCVLFVFLTHSAEYESFSLPLGIILIVPLGILFALCGVWIRGMENDLFVQIGFVVLAGLAAKNAVLIIEFAKQQHEHGLSIPDAAVEASRLRLRPILMTSFAFILGVVPLVISKGAGAEMRQRMGTAVFTGMLGVTLCGIFLTPVFYTVLQRFSERLIKRFRARTPAEDQSRTDSNTQPG